MTDKNYETGYDLGAKIACAVNGIKPADAVKAASFNTAIVEDPQMQGDICKVACAILDSAGDTSSEAYMLYKKACADIATGKTLTKVAAEAFLFPVVESLSAAANEIHEEVLEKSAGLSVVPWLNRAFGTAGKGMAMTSELYSKLLALSIGLGGSGGALAWYLNRDANQDEADTEAKLEQAKHYKRIANDIKSRLAASKQSIQNAAETQGDGAYLV